MYYRLYIIILVSLITQTVLPNDTTNINRNKKIIASVSTGIIYSGSLIYLNQIWYKPYQTSKFHFFDDTKEWFLMDKCGHTFTAFYATQYLSKIYQSATFQYPEIMASSITFSYLLSIEILDGFSSGWGFSFGDLTANSAGILLFYMHHRLHKQLFVPKFSYYPTPYPSLNPTLLGKNSTEQLIKDYNGQTYWLSITPFYQWKPNMEWLCISLGYGIDGSIGAQSNYFYRNNQLYDYRNIPRNTQWYLSIDVDLSKIKTKKKWLNKIFQSINAIKIPAPALEWKGNNLYFRPLLFSN